jgi:hypothetical protein
MPVSYPGLEIRYASMSFSRGVTPSVATVLAVPQGTLDLSPRTLTFEFNGQTVQFQDAAIHSAYVRRRRAGGWLHSIQILDRRWRWAFGGIGGEFNKRSPSGSIAQADQRTPAQLMTLCLNAMGEAGYDLSRVPSGVFPYVNWDGGNPALALADLCDYVACEVVLNHLTNRVEIWPLGVGNTNPTGFGEEHPKFAYKAPAKIPSSIQVHCGPSRFQNKLKLRAVLTDNTGTQKLINESSITPSGGWVTQALHFPGVSAASQAVAVDQAWKDFRVVGQADGSLAVPQCPSTITSVGQYHLSDYQLLAETDTTGTLRALPYAVGGTFFSYSEVPGNFTNTHWAGRTTLHKDRRLVRLHDPCIALTSAGLLTEPTLFLVTSYTVTDTDGSPIHVFRSGNVGGGGGTLVLLRPEIFSAHNTTYSQGGDGTSIVGTVNNLTDVNAEADQYIQMFQRKFGQPFASELTYAGIIPGTLDGNVCQVRWELGVNRDPKTMACEVEELDVSATPKTERRRREILQKVAEATRQWR